MGKSGGKRPLLRLRHRLKDDIKMNFSRSGIGRYGLEGSGSGYGQLAGAFECGNEPSGSIKCG